VAAFPGLRLVWLNFHGKAASPACATIRAFVAAFPGLRLVWLNFRGKVASPACATIRAFVAAFPGLRLVWLNFRGKVVRPWEVAVYRLGIYNVETQDIASYLRWRRKILRLYYSLIIKGSRPFDV
jgi:hypothetical protein